MSGAALKTASIAASLSREKLIVFGGVFVGM
jgi:hypothetical protein